MRAVDFSSIAPLASAEPARRSESADARAGFRTRRFVGAVPPLDADVAEARFAVFLLLVLAGVETALVACFEPDFGPVLDAGFEPDFEAGLAFAFGAAADRDFDAVAARPVFFFAGLELAAFFPALPGFFAAACLDLGVLCVAIRMQA